MNIQELIERHHANNAGFCRHYMTLYSMVLGMETKSAFEFGSGFSSKVILMALEKTGGKLITCDNRSLDQTAIFYNKEEMLKYTNWQYLQKKSKEIYEDLKEEKFDFVLHDGAHDVPTVQEDIKHVFPRMKQGAIFLLHDTNHSTVNYNLIKCIQNINWCKISYITLPYGYGLTIVTIEEDFGNGKVYIKWQKEQK
jgi:predicted O-methyltransferase YrrM